MSSGGMRWWWVAGAISAVAVSAAAFVALTREHKPPNVLIILWDTTRADRLSVYGYDLETTPRMAAWANESGLVFENAISPDMWTVPSHASLFTGLPPSTHGAGLDHRWLDGHNQTLAELFGEKGWDTYAFSANPNLQPDQYNLLQGFQSVDLAWSRKWMPRVADNTESKLIPRDKSTEISPGRRKKRNKRSMTYNAGPVTHEAFVRWLTEREDPEKPFFAYLSYMEAHKPRVPSMSSRKKVADDETIKTGLATDLTFKSQLLYSYDKKSYTPEELTAINRVYDASLRDLDDATADLLDDLDERGILDDTIVVFTADHGEQLGEHQLFGHRSAIYQALLHVPLVISYPRGLSPERVRDPVSNLHIYDTLLELAGLEPPETPHARGSLLGAARKVTAVFSETMSIDRIGFRKVQKIHPDLSADVWGHIYRSVIAGGHKLIQTIDFDDHSVVHCELYDLSADPDENSDIFESKPDKVSELTKALSDWKRTTVPWNPDLAENPPALSTADQRAMQAIGYLTADEGEEDDQAAHPPPDPRQFDEADLASRCARR